MNELADRISAQARVTVPFQDADPMGVTWHGNYLRYLETARAALLERIDYGYRQMTESGYAWPIVDARLKFVKTSTYGQDLLVEAILVEYENRLKIDYSVTDAGSGVRILKAHTIQVAVTMSSGEMCFVSPPILIEKIRQCAA